MDSITPLQAALIYASRGWPVLRVKKDKSPLTSFGVKDASTNPEAMAWWKRWPDANVPTAAGAPIAVLKQPHTTLPDTLRGRAGDGAHHYL